MKVPTVFALFLFVSSAAAFGLAGCYERMLYWYAYQLDRQAGGRKIAKGCRGAGGGDCNLKEFILFIADNDDDRTAARNLNAQINEPNMSADRGAGLMYNGGVSKGYQSNQIMEKTEGTVALFEKISGFIEGKTSSIPLNVDKDPLKQIMTARKRVETLRVANNHRDIGNSMRDDFDPDHKHLNNQPGRPAIEQGLIRENTDVRLPVNDLPVVDCDLQAAGRAIKADNRPDFNTRDYITSWGAEHDKEDNHKGNIDMIKKARIVMSNGQCNAAKD